MYENAVIKKFETSQIEVRATNVYETTGKTLVLYVISYIFIVSGMYWGLSTQTPPQYNQLEIWAISLLTGVFGGGAITLMFHMTDTWKKPIPSYRVLLIGTTDTHYDRSVDDTSEIYITKTTLEVDQVEICKAAQSLEQIAIEFDKNQRAMQQIAEKCK